MRTLDWWIFGPPFVALLLAMSPVWLLHSRPAILLERPSLVLRPTFEDPPSGVDRATPQRSTTMNHMQRPAEIRGRIMRASRLDGRVLLKDGTALLIPDSLRAARRELEPGNRIWASYELKNGQKIATTVAIQTVGRDH